MVEFQSFVATCRSLKLMSFYWTVCGHHQNGPVGVTVKLRLKRNYLAKLPF